MTIKKNPKVYGVPQKGVKQKFSVEGSLPVAIKMAGKKFVYWGKDNKFSNKLLTLYQTSTKHNAIINGKVNYIAGNGWQVSDDIQDIDKAKALQFIESPNRYETLNDLSKKYITDYEIFNGIALELVFNANYQLAEFCQVDFGSVRVNEDQTEAYIIEHELGGQEKIVETYKIFSPEEENVIGKRLFYYREYSPSTKYYTKPTYIGALGYIEVDARIENFHKENLKYGFLGAYLFEFNNGVPTDEEQRDIKDRIITQLGGDQGERIVVVFNDRPEVALKMSPLDSGNSIDQFNSLNEQVKEEIFVSHRVTSPMLFGIRTEGSLGGRTEIIEAYEIFKEVYVNDRIQTVERIINYLFELSGGKGVLTIIPKPPIPERLTEQTLTTILTKNELRELAGYPPLEEPNPVQMSSQTNDEKEFALFQKFGVPASDFFEIRKRPMQFSYLSHEAEQKFASQYADLDTAILQLLQETPTLTAKDIATELAMPEETISERITYMVNEGLIKITGALKELGESGKAMIETRKPQPLVQVMYKYDVAPQFGPKKLLPTSRDFCVNMIGLNRYYSREDIDEISNIMGYSVWERRGGWYHAPDGRDLPSCRHIWNQVLVKPKRNG